MEHERRLTLAKILKRLALIEPLLFRRRESIGAFRYMEHADASEPGLVDLDVDDSTWPLIEPQTYWGRWDTSFTMRSRFRIPGQWIDHGPMGLLLNIGEIHNWDFCHPEALVYIDGRPVAGCDKYHHLIYIAPDFCDGHEHLLALHGYTGRWGYFEDPPAMKLFMQKSEIVQIDKATQSFIATARVAAETAKVLDANKFAKGRILNALDRAFKRLEFREPFGEAFYESVPKAHEVLKNELVKAGASLDVNVTAIGHSHIDVAWLWPLWQTRRKCGRSFHTVLTLMDEFPQYTFTQSQPQLYDYVRQDYPELFQRIKGKVAEGRWEAIGGMWVEADCNISGAESLARQFLLGRTFFAEHFGPETDTPILWLPDVFGYPYCLPQLIKQAGLKYFYTTKLAWNQYNRMPYDSFWWQGIDGTKVLTHLGTTPEAGSSMTVTYNGKAVPEEIYKTWTSCKQKELHTDLMTSFGYGDGGGGPTREMLENIREMADFPGLPRTRHGRAIDFFTRLEQSTTDRLPTWNGELYLEYHRGTYTTQSRNKKANRKSEFMLHDAEWLASQACLLDKAFHYPHDRLREAWKLVCLNQFHDIIPGSSIGEVYAESLQQYEQIEQIATSVRSEALACIAGTVGGGLILANPTAFEQNEPILWSGKLAPNQLLRRPDGLSVFTQQVETGTLIDVGPIGPLKIIPLTFELGQSEDLRTDLSVSPSHLENNHLRVKLNKNGDIISIYDKTINREVLSEGALANEFQAFEDHPIEWDAWDIDIFYDDKMWTAEPAESIRVVEAGPLRATIEVKRRILNSEYTQRISLNHNSRQLDIDTDIDWREKHILLKTAFPVAILANEATYEIQWGNVQRPTHRNTSWDWARFEVCAQKWVDLSEGNYGVSLLNDYKYGHDIKDNVIRITLLRGPTMPDPSADRGMHRFKYSLLPHAGSLDHRIIAAAYGLNDPVIVFESTNPSTRLWEIEPIVSVDNKNIIIETIKQAEDSNGIIVRMYESMRQRGKVTVRTSFELGKVHKTNLLEQTSESLNVQNNSATLYIRPFEIVTLRLIQDA
jgi:alpha-mannosidase